MSLIEGEEQHFKLNTTANHFANNALGALIVVKTLNCDLVRACESLSAWIPGVGRGLVRKINLDISELPQRFVAATPCFRKEAGSYGKDTKGMMRQHQFYKVELVNIVEPKNCITELDRMLNCAEEILKKLEIPYQIVLLSSGDMGFSAEKTFDIEVWIPSEKKYREISSCSSCGSFQARRMGAKYKTSSGNEYVGTLNGSGLAAGRLMIALIENNQNEDGSITIPNILKKYMNNLDKI